MHSSSSRSIFELDVVCLCRMHGRRKVKERYKKTNKIRNNNNFYYFEGFVRRSLRFESERFTLCSICLLNAMLTMGKRCWDRYTTNCILFILCKSGFVLWMLTSVFHLEDICCATSYDFSFEFCCILFKFERK